MLKRCQLPPFNILLKRCQTRWRRSLALIQQNVELQGLAPFQHLMRHRISARPPSAIVVRPRTDEALIGRFLEDAAHYPGGHAAAVWRMRSVEEVSALLRLQPRHVLAVGAQSSLTGGATPQGD